MSFIADASSSTDAAGGGGIKHYAYTFGDGTTESSSAPTAGHVYASHGTYPCTVTVTNKKGKSNTCPPVTATVTVAPVEPPIEPPVEPPDTGLVPPECRTTWAPGVQGGIPARTTIFTTIDASEYADGAEEASAAINAAIAECIPGDAIVLSAGTFLCNDHILLHKAVTLRGAGPGKTVLVKTNGAKPGSYQPEEAEPVVIIGSSRWPQLAASSVYADGVKGALFVDVEDAAGLAPGTFVLLDRDDYAAGEWCALPPRNGAPTDVTIWASDQVVFAKHNPPDPADDPFPDSLTWFSRSGRPVNEIKEIASIQGNVVTFTTPLHTDYPVTKSAQLTRWTVPHVQGAGLEDLTVQGGSDGNIRFEAAASCWMKNVENTAWLGEAVSINGSFRVEVRDSYIHDCVHPYPGGGGYGIGLSGGSSEILIENNISIGMNKVMVAKSAGAGSVVGYNYMDNGFIGNYLEWVEVGINGSHMVGGHHILFEGNQSNNYDSDDTHGSAFGMTIFRNHLTGVRRDYPGQVNARCVGLMFGSWWHAFIGNVLGQDGQMAGWSYDQWAEHTVWKFGYAPSHWEQVADPKVLSTVLRDGNFDYLTNAVAWDRPTQALPVSLYLTAKPAFFGATSWPWVDASGATKLGTLPARARYEALVAPPPVEPPPSTGNPHAFFEMMKAGPLGSTCRKSMSLRASSGPDAPIPDTPYAVQDVAYVYGSDPYHSPKDGAKIHITVFRPLSPDWLTPQLTGPLAAGAVSMTVNDAGLFEKTDLHFLIDGEVLSTGLPTGLTVPIMARGLFGTTPAAHSPGASLRPVRHSSFEQVHVPIAFGDGLDHLFTFDIWFGPETTYALQGHSSAAAKSFRFEITPPGMDRIYLQGSHGAYKSTNPTVDCGPFEYWWGGLLNYPHAPTVDKPMSPYVSRPTILPSRWVRHYILFKQRAGAVGDDQFWSWVADEVSGPILTHDGTQISCEAYGATTGLLRLIEFHSSADGRIASVANPNVIPPDRVWYMRNYTHNAFPPDTDLSSILAHRPEA